MKGLKQKIAINLLTQPSSVMPGLLGISLLLLSVIMGKTLALFGVLCLLGSLGMLATNLVFNLDSIANQSVQEMIEAKAREKEAALNALDRKLASDDEPRDQLAFRNLRILITTFRNDLKSGAIKCSHSGLVQNLDQTFDSLVARFDEQFAMGKTAEGLQGKLRKKMLKDRAAALDDIEQRIENVANVMAEIRTMEVSYKKSELDAVERRLHDQLAVAKAVGESMRQMEDELALGDTAKYKEYD